MGHERRELPERRQAAVDRLGGAPGRWTGEGMEGIGSGYAGQEETKGYSQREKQKKGSGEAARRSGSRIRRKGQEV